jgi:hypothetical protein
LFPAVEIHAQNVIPFEIQIRSNSDPNSTQLNSAQFASSSPIATALSSSGVRDGQQISMVGQQWHCRIPWKLKCLRASAEIKIPFNHSPSSSAQLHCSSLSQPALR